MMAAAVAAVAWLGYAGVFTRTPATVAAGSTDPGADADGLVRAAPGSAAPGTLGEGGVPADIDASAAVILPDPPVSAATVVDRAPSPVSSVAGDTQTLSTLFVPTTAAKRTATRPRAPRRAVAHTDSDVALLTDLLRHVEAGDPAERGGKGRTPIAVNSIEARMQACPAANTGAGIDCRKRLCAGHSGKTPACPAGESGRRDEPE